MLSVQATPASRTIGERGTAEFVATASGINMINFMYQWRKRGSDSLPYKVSGVNEAILTIPNLIVSDEGQYYCVVTNEWGRSVESDDARLTVKGTFTFCTYFILKNSCLSIQSTVILLYPYQTCV